MKLKKIVSLFLGCCLLLLTGCGESEFTAQWSTDPSGNRVLINEWRTTAFPETLPANITYNGNRILVTDVDAYQDLLSDYSYCVYLVVEINVSGLDDAQIHWLRESDINVSAFLTSEKNKYDFNSMHELGNLLVTDEEVVYYVFTSSFFEENRYSFTEAEVTLAVDVTQEEVYQYVNDEGKARETNKEEGISYMTSPASAAFFS